MQENTLPRKPGDTEGYTCNFSSLGKQKSLLRSYVSMAMKNILVSLTFSLSTKKISQKTDEKMLLKYLQKVVKGRGGREENNNQIYPEFARIKPN